MPVKVLIVDDSAFMRQIFFRMLSADPELTVVATAKDGLDALDKIDEYNPDVVTLDVAMPNMDGLECLAAIMEFHPLPVIMVSSLTREGAETTIQAFELGAIDFVTKSSIGQLEDTVSQELIQKIKIAASVKETKLGRALKGKPGTVPSSTGIFSHTRLEVLAIGCSTGGPKALYQLLPLFPKNFPLGIIVAQHMPKDFTATFATRLDTVCQLNVREAQTGSRVQPGTILIAPSGWQSRVVRQETKLAIEVSDQANMIYKPSVDFLFQSLVETCHGNVLSVLLTGMGSDGAASMKKLRDLGARTIAESSESSVVFGMPRVAIELGGAEFVENLANIYERIVKIVNCTG